jgi:hypothetical protein
MYDATNWNPNHAVIMRTRTCTLIIYSSTVMVAVFDLVLDLAPGYFERWGGPEPGQHLLIMRGGGVAHH